MDILLTLSISVGQLLKFSLGGRGGITILDLTVIILCFWGLFVSKFRFKKPSSWILAGLIFTLCGLASLIITPLQLLPSEYFISLTYLIRFSVYILLAWLMYSGTLQKLKKNISNIFFRSGFILAILGLLQLIFLPNLIFLEKYGWDPHYFRTASTFLDPNFLGAYLTLTLLLMIQYFSTRKHFRIFFAIVFIGLLTTFSRGAYLAFLSSFLSLSFLNKSIKQFILTIILFSTLLVGFNIYQVNIAKPRGIDRGESAQSRQNSWEQGWQIFLHSPLLGVGFNSYPFALKQYKLADEKFLEGHGSTTNDSSLLYILATTGIVGLISYLLFLKSLAKKSRVLKAALVGLLAQSFFANTFFYPPILIWIILMGVYEDKTSS